MLMFENFLYIFLPSSGITLLWFFSPIKLSLANLLFKQDIFDQSMFDELLSNYSSFLSKLSGCIYCIYFWVCLIFCCYNFSSIENFIFLFFSCNYIHIILNKYVYGL